MKNLFSSHKFILTICLTCVTIFATHGQVADEEYTIEDIAAMESRRFSLNEAKSDEGVNGLNYDWQYAECFWEIDPWNKYIKGSVIHTIELITSADSVSFDMNSALTVNGVSVNGMPANAEFIDNLSFCVHLPSTLAAGTEVTVEIDYEGEPIPSDVPAFFQSFHGESIPEIYTLSEPYGALDWWPCKQTLIDKLDSVFIEITVPSGNKAGSNGELRYTNTNGDGTVSFGWHHGFPIPAYLVSIAVTNYAEFSQYVDLGEDEVHILTYVYPEQMEAAQINSEVTPGLMQLFSDLFGMYAYTEEKYGHAQSSIGGGMEHTTMSTMGNFTFNLIAHELAHQWFGDKLTCGSWSDIWLNEGFATYATGLSSEFLGSSGDWEDWKSNNITRAMTEPGGSVYVLDTLSRDRVFDGRLSYRKGALVLHMLRWKMGDKLFFEGLRQYVANPEYAFGYVKTPDFQASMEAIFGQDLGEYFEDWIYGQGYPKYELLWWPVSGGIAVQVNQETSHPSVSFFEMPVQILINKAAGDSLHTLNNEFNGQVFIINSVSEVLGIAFDPNKWLMAESTVRYNADNDYPEIAIVPNPATTDIWVSILSQNFNAEGFEIVNTQGKVIDTYQPSVGLRESFKWNVSTYPAGVYIMRFIAGSATTSISFVKI